MSLEEVAQVREEMLKEYLSFQLKYVEFTSYIENKIKNVLVENGIKYQSLKQEVNKFKV